jgi:Sodium:dicarboxylate symporter family
MEAKTTTAQPVLTLHEEDQDNAVPQAGCGILGRYPVLSVLLFALAGVAVGVGLTFWEPEDPEDKTKCIKWLGLIGDMFIRALKAVVLPLVFVNVILSMVDMMSVGRASAVGGKSIGLVSSRKNTLVQGTSPLNLSVALS